MISDPEFAEDLYGEGGEGQIEKQIIIDDEVDYY